METSRIHRLEAQLANQIAAGEVVERPGSALKELVENSLDAGATQISVKVTEGGAKLLEVADNGKGIHPEDLLLALDRHATSKIRKTEDLFAISSWGFRGEALASIGAVSRITLSSRQASESMGREIICEGGVVREDRRVARPVGTTVRVEDLFFNTPARKKFQKSVGAESTYCAQTFHRLALSSPECAMEFENNGEKIFSYPARASTAARVADVYRLAWKLPLEEKDLVEIQAKSDPLALRAWILPSKYFIPSSRGILLYVNQRSVKDKLLLQAVTTAAREVIFGSLMPQLVLELETPPDAVDVNVHPAKAEVRFRDSGHVFAFVRKHIEKALAEDRRGSVSFPTQESPAAPEPAGLFAPSTHFHQKISPSLETESFSSALEPMEHQAYAPPPAYSGPQFLGTIRNTYLICQDEEGLILVDQHAAHERVTYEKLKKTQFSSAQASRLLIPIQVELPREWLDRLESEFDRFADLGLQLDRTSPTVLAVRELPVYLMKANGAPAFSVGNFLRSLMEDWQDNQDETVLAEKFRSRLLEQLATQSCHGSVRAGQNLSSMEAMALLQQMSETDFSGHCPHGRPTTVRFRWAEIERLFKRTF